MIHTETYVSTYFYSIISAICFSPVCSICPFVPQTVRNETELGGTTYTASLSIFLCPRACMAAHLPIKNLY